MTRITVAAAFALAVTLLAVSAQAQSPRTFVSAAGSDSNPCSFAAPCRHFQAAVNATSAGGEVDALDPAGYGPITIGQAITIEGQGWSYIAPPASGNGITINAVSGNVAIHGVSLNGAGITGGTNGIVFNSGGSLTVTGCVVQNFVTIGNNPGVGILIQPNSGAVNFAITNTIASNNEYGIFYTPTSTSPKANGNIDHVVATANQIGIEIDTLANGGPAEVAISNSIVSNNGDLEIFTAGSVAMSVDNITLNGNGTGIKALSPAAVMLTRSVIQGNGTGTDNQTSNTFYTYGNNLIDLNGTNFSGGALYSGVTLR